MKRLSREMNFVRTSRSSLLSSKGEPITCNCMFERSIMIREGVSACDDCCLYWLREETCCHFCGWMYESNMADLRELWSYIHPRLTRDRELAEEVDVNLDRMFYAFENPEEAERRAAAWAIYLNFRKLR